MGYVHTDVTVFETNRVAQLTVAISVLSQKDQVQPSFSLIVNTSDGTATGLPQNLQFDFMYTTYANKHV